MKVLNYILFAGAIMTLACTPKQEAINYGHDGCDYCKMTIVDPRYAAELVTDKGKVYKFDAVECMVNYKNEHRDTHFALQLVSTFDAKTLTPSKDCYYLRSEALPSPMGMYITPFSTENVARKEAKNNGGKVYSWEHLNANFNQLPEVRPMVLNEGK